MAKKSKASKEAAAPVSGYRRPPRYRDFSYREMPGLQEGEDPLTITIPVNLSFEELDAIPAGAGQTYEEVFKAISPYVVSWNVTRLNLQSGQMELVPPPAEAGPEVLQVLDHVEAHWVMDKVKYGYLTMLEDAQKVAELVRQAQKDERKNASGPSGDGPEHENSND